LYDATGKNGYVWQVRACYGVDNQSTFSITLLNGSGTQEGIMKARSFVQLAVMAVVLVVLFSVRLDPAQAKAEDHTPFRTVEKRTTLADALITGTSRVAIVPSNGAVGPAGIRPPLPAHRPSPVLGPDWLIQLTVVVIVLSGSAGVLGSHLTRTARRRAGRS
jgi:hypothetical protein